MLGDDGPNLRCNRGRVVVLPHSYDRPAGRGEAEIHFSISGHVSLKLGLPVIAVRLRGGSVLRATVPEATVDEDSDLLSREDNIRLHESVREPDWVMLAKAQPEPVKSRPDRDLGLGVSSPVRSHPDRHLLTRRVWVREPCHLASRVAPWWPDLVPGRCLSGALEERTYVRG